MIWQSWLRSIWLTSTTLTWTLALIVSDKVPKGALDTRHPCWDQHIRSIYYIMLYYSKDAYWLSRYWLSLSLRTSCMGVRTEETCTTRPTLCGESQRIIIPFVLFGIADNRYYKSSKNNRLWCTVHHIALPSVLASPVLFQSLKQKAYNSLAGQYHCWRTQLMFRGAWLPWIKLLSNLFPCSHHFSTPFPLSTTTVSGLLCCCIVTETPFAQHSFNAECTIHGTQRSVGLDWRTYPCEMSTNKVSEHP